MRLGRLSSENADIQASLGRRRPNVLPVEAYYTRRRLGVRDTDSSATLPLATRLAALWFGTRKTVALRTIDTAGV